MKVLELVLKWGSGGVERYVEDLVAAASAHGIDCSVASVTTIVCVSLALAHWSLVGLREP